MALQPFEPEGRLGSPQKVCNLYAAGNCRHGTGCKLLHELRPKKSVNVLVNNRAGPSGRVPSVIPNSREEDLRRAKEQAIAVRLARIEQGGTTQAGQKELAAQHAQEQVRAAERQRQDELAKEDGVSFQQVIMNCIVKLEAGLTVRDIICGFETSQILVKNLPMRTTKSEIVELFTWSRYRIDEHNLAILRTETSFGRQQAIVVAKKADLETFLPNVTGLRGTSLEYLPCAQSSEGRTMSLNNNSHLTISWRIPTLTMVARYPSSKTWAIRVMARKLNGQLLNGHRVQVEYEEQQVYEGYSPDPKFRHTLEPGVCPQIKISLIPPRTTMMEIFTFARTRDVEPHYVTSKEIFDALDTRFRTLPHSIFTSLTSETTSDPDTASLRAVFSSSEGAQLANNSLKGNVIPPNFPPFDTTLSDPYSFVLTLGENEYNALRTQWIELKESFVNHVTIQISDIEHDYGREVVVILSGQDERVVGVVKARIENMIAGQKLDATYWHPGLKSPKGQKFLDSLFHHTSAYARVDWDHNRVTLFGDPQALEAAKLHVREEIHRLLGEQWTIPFQPRMLNFFKWEGLEKMRALLGEANVSLDEKATKIALRGTDPEEARHHFKQITAAFGGSSPMPAVEQDRTPCSTCGATVSQVIEVSCRHVYCTSCLRHYILSAFDNRDFPLKCAGSNGTCGKPLSLPLIQRFLPSERFQEFAVVAFNLHMEKSSEALRHCTTLGCPQVYTTTSSQREIKCPSCFSEICTACHAEGHSGMTCVERKAHSDAGTLPSRSARQPQSHDQSTVGPIRRASNSTMVHLVEPLLGTPSTLSLTVPASPFFPTVSSHATAPFTPGTSPEQSTDALAEHVRQALQSISNTAIPGVRSCNGTEAAPTIPQNQFPGTTHRNSVVRDRSALEPIRRGQQRAEEEKVRQQAQGVLPLTRAWGDERAQHRAESGGCCCRVM